MSAEVRVSFTWRQFMEAQSLHPTLQELLLDVLSHWPEEDGNFTAECTCIKRTPAEEKAAGGVSGVHMQGPPFRAIDLRNKDWGGDRQAVAEKLAETIHGIWVYDPSRPAMKVIVVAVHGSGPHVHLQVCPATRRRVV